MSRRGLSALLVPALAAAGVLTGLGIGWAAARYGSLLHLEPTPTHALAVLGALMGAAALVRWPAAALLTLVLVVYLHLSDVLIRFHDLPSILQLFALPLALAALAEWRSELLEGLAPRPIVAALTAYVAVLLLSSLVAVDGALANESVAAAGKGFAVFLLVLLLASTPERVRWASWAVVAGATLLAGLTLIQVLTGSFENTFGGLARVDYGQVYGSVVEARAAGPLGDPNFFAQILLIAVPVALLLAWKERARWLRVAAFVAAGVIATGTVATYSRGGALALGAVVLLSLFAGRPGRWRIAAGAAALIGGLLLLPPDFTRRLDTLRGFLPGRERTVELDSSVRNRILLMRTAWRMFEDRPVLGVGAGNYTARYHEYAERVGATVSEYEDIGRPHYPHDLYLEVAAESGFLGLVAFGGALLLVFGHLRRAERVRFDAGEDLYGGLAVALQVALAGYLVAALFLHGHYPRYLWLLLGLAAALARDTPGPPERRRPSGGRAA